MTPKVVTVFGNGRTRCVTIPAVAVRELNIEIGDVLLMSIEDIDGAGAPVIVLTPAVVVPRAVTP